MGLYATAVGAGTLFLPITVGSNSPVILLFILLMAFPLSYYSHRALSRLVLSSSHREGDITHVVEEHFGAKAGKLLMLVYLMASMTTQVPALWRQYPALRGLLTGAAG